jgi:large subunit ribosomal protein L28
MGIPYPLKVWRLGQAVARKEPMADLKRWGILPHELRHSKAIMPTLLHGKKITFGDSVSEKGKNHTRRAFIPNILYKPLYSRSLEMLVWSCLSATALREIDASGGFDEYITKVSLTKLPDSIALMYRERIQEAMKVCLIYKGSPRKLPSEPQENG